MKHSRNKLQELIMICIYQYLFYYNDEKRPSLKQIIFDVTGLKLNELDSFTSKLIRYSIEYAHESVPVISSYLKDWEFTRLNLVEQAILLTSYTQVIYLEQPKQIAIDVAIRLAKKYASDDSYKFINGVLDKCLP